MFYQSAEYERRAGLIDAGWRSPDFLPNGGIGEIGFGQRSTVEIRPNLRNWSAAGWRQVH
jgi:hypothetical protein